MSSDWFRVEDLRLHQNERIRTWSRATARVWNGTGDDKTRLDIGTSTQRKDYTCRQKSKVPHVETGLNEQSDREVTPGTIRIVKVDTMV